MIKVSSKKIFGGYNPIGYEPRRLQWLSSSDSFIFSFQNEGDIHEVKIGRVINATKSVWKNCNRTFFNFGFHLFINGRNLCLSNRGNYDDIFNIDIGKSFELPIEEIENFLLDKEFLKFIDQTSKSLKLKFI